MEDPDFYALAKEALLLNSLQDSVKEGIHRLSVFKEMLSRRAREVESTAKKGQQKLDVQLLNALVNERNELAGQLAEAEKKQDYKAFSAPDFAAADAQLQKLEQEYSVTAPELTAEERSQIKARIDRLTGMVLWNSMDEYQQNRSALVTALQTLDAQLNLLKHNFVRLKEDFGKGERFFSSKIERVSKLKHLYSSLQQDLGEELAGLDQRLTTKGVELLNQHYEQIDSYYVRSQLALVNLYDDLALADLKKSQAKKAQGEAPL
ncbi:hypothetical protein [Hahella ganghwensis]|uniref:hypothetical protein n=1 Tax=Hahella ganghwensis TaxID=286420 RepID=UPI0003777886|nr:hypothetical protein [Hahella ganghwensis]